MEVFGEPRGGFRNVNEAVLDQRGLRVQAQDLLGGRLVAGHTVAAISYQLLDELSAGGLVLDQHLGRIKQALLLEDGPLERRILEPPSEHTEEEDVLATHSPGCAYREITELGGLVGGVPALHDAV